MAKAFRTIAGSRIPVTTLVGRVVGIEGPHLSVRIETVDGDPADPEHTEHTAWAGTDHETTSSLVYAARPLDRAGRPVPVKMGDPVTFILDEGETMFLETRVNGVLTDSHRWD